MKKYIFLDVDGVITTNKSDTFFDKECVERVKKLAEVTGSQIVLSSDWRLTWSPKDFSEKIKNEVGVELGMKLHTPIIKFTDTLTRGEEISNFLAGLNYGTYVILDDLPESEFDGHHLHFVHCNTSEGFTEDGFKKAKKILNFEI